MEVRGKIKNARVWRQAILPLLACLIAFGACLVAAPKAFAVDDIAVYVGYIGGPYYEKATVSASWLNSAASNQGDYQRVEGGSVTEITGVKGVPLGSVLADAAGVETGNLLHVVFNESAGKKGYDFNSPEGGMDYTDLFTRRYYFEDLADYLAGDGASPSGVRVDPLIATKAKHGRSTYSGNRLLYGLVDEDDNNVVCAYRVKSITCIYDNDLDRPEIVLENSEVSGEVGSTVSIPVSFKSADPVIAANALAEVAWTSSDGGSVLRDLHYDPATQSVVGTVVGEGAVTLSGSYGNSSNPGFVVNATASATGRAASAAGGDDPTDPGEGGGAGGGAGDGNGTGTGDGSGEGSGEGAGSGEGSDGGGAGDSDAQADAEGGSSGDGEQAGGGSGNTDEADSSASRESGDSDTSNTNPQTDPVTLDEVPPVVAQARHEEPRVPENEEAAKASGSDAASLAPGADGGSAGGGESSAVQMLRMKQDSQVADVEVDSLWVIILAALLVMGIAARIGAFKRAQLQKIA